MCIFSRHTLCMYCFLKRPCSPEYLSEVIMCMEKEIEMDIKYAGAEDQ